MQRKWKVLKPQPLHAVCDLRFPGGNHTPCNLGVVECLINHARGTIAKSTKMALAQPAHVQCYEVNDVGSARVRLRAEGAKCARVHLSSCRIAESQPLLRRSNSGTVPQNTSIPPRCYRILISSRLERRLKAMSNWWKPRSGPLTSGSIRWNEILDPWLKGVGILLESPETIAELSQSPRQQPLQTTRGFTGGMWEEKLDPTPTAPAAPTNLGATPFSVRECERQCLCDV